MISKSGGAVGDRRGSSTASIASSKFLVIVLKSPCVGDFIISKKREHRVLTVKNVFPINKPGNVSVKKFLPTPIYN